MGLGATVVWLTIAARLRSDLRRAAPSCCCKGDYRRVRRRVFLLGFGQLRIDVGEFAAQIRRDRVLRDLLARY
jgi:hypothetical protein